MLSQELDRISDDLSEVIDKYGDGNYYQPEVISELMGILKKIDSLSIRIETSGIESLSSENELDEIDNGEDYYASLGIYPHSEYPSTGLDDDQDDDLEPEYYE